LGQTSTELGLMGGGHLHELAKKPPTLGGSTRACARRSTGLGRRWSRPRRSSTSATMRLAGIYAKTLSRAVLAEGTNSLFAVLEAPIDCAPPSTTYEATAHERLRASASSLRRRRQREADAPRGEPLRLPIHPSPPTGVRVSWNTYDSDIKELFPLIRRLATWAVELAGQGRRCLRGGA
jgi:hypothetical protein